MKKAGIIVVLFGLMALIIGLAFRQEIAAEYHKSAMYMAQDLIWKAGDKLGSRFQRLRGKLLGVSIEDPFSRYSAHENKLISSGYLEKRNFRLSDQLWTNRTLQGVVYSNLFSIYDKELISVSRAKREDGVRATAPVARWPELEPFLKKEIEKVEATLR